LFTTPAWGVEADPGCGVAAELKDELGKLSNDEQAGSNPKVRFADYTDKWFCLTMAGS
jgi:hypothetical protein